MGRRPPASSPRAEWLGAKGFARGGWRCGGLNRAIGRKGLVLGFLVKAASLPLGMATLTHSGVSIKGANFATHWRP